MGIGIDKMKEVIASGDRAEIAAAVDLGNAALHAIDTGTAAAERELAEESRPRLAALQRSHIAAKLDAVVNPKSEPVEPVKGEQPNKAK